MSYRIFGLVMVCAWVWPIQVRADDAMDTPESEVRVIEPMPQSAERESIALRGSADPQALVAAIFDMAQRRNVRQMVLRDSLRPYFVTDDDTDRFIVLLTHKVGQKRLVRDAFFRWSQRRLDVDTAYGYAEAHVHLRGVSRFWLPRGTMVILQLTQVDGRWFAKGPELTNIDLL